MEVLFHGIFTIIKLAILGCIYATLTLLIFRVIGHLKPDSWANQVSKKKFKFWFLSGAIISVGLVVFANTHWGAHGLGDSARIPLKYGKSINLINSEPVYIEGIDYKYGELWIGEFAKTADYVVGKTTTSPVDDPPDFFAWDLKTNQVQYFDTKSDFEKFAQSNRLPLTNEFKDFGDYYSEFWSGWRFWTLL